MKEASAGVEILEPLEVAAQASSSTAPALCTKAGTPVPGTDIDKVHALHGAFPLPLLHFCSFAPSPFLLVALAEAFPDSAKDAAAAVEECRAEYHIVRHENPKAELSSEELMASIKGRLQPTARLGSQLCTAVASVFEVLWPGRAEPDDAE
jgi:hypothetical protein